MKIENATVLITGANRGIGLAFAQAALARGAAKVYAGARDPSSVALPGLALHVGFVDTDLTQAFDVPKLAPALVVQRAFDALERGALEVLVDERTQRVKQGLSAEPGVYLEAR